MPFFGMVPREAENAAFFFAQRPFVLLVVKSLCATVRPSVLVEWCQGWVLTSGCSDGQWVRFLNAWCSICLDIAAAFASRRRAADGLHVFVVEVIKSCDIVEKYKLDSALGRLGMLSLGEVEEGDPPRVPFDYGFFAVALCVPWCGILRSKEVLLPGFYADNLMCVGP